MAALPAGGGRGRGAARRGAVRAPGDGAARRGAGGAGLSGPPAGWRPCTRESRRCEYWTWGADYLRPDCCTQALRELLFFSGELLARHGIFHWLDYGALLGAVRGGALVPWDSDVDWGVWRTDLPAIGALEPEIVRAGFRLDTRDPQIWRIDWSATNTQHVDLFPHWREGERVRVRYGSDTERWSFSGRYLEKLERVRLEGREFPAPAPVEEFLAERYGEEWRTPRRTG